MKNIYLKCALGLAVGLTVLNSCVKDDDYSVPPIECNNKYSAPTISLADFVNQAPATGVYKVTKDQIFDGYVVSSDEQGNFYKTISIQDKAENPTIGLQIEVDKSSNFANFPVGAHVRINANGLVLGKDRGTIKLGTVDPNFSIGRIPEIVIGRYFSGVCNGNGMEIAKLVPLELATLADAKNDKYINMLVKVKGVQFSAGELGKTYIDYNAAGAGVDSDRNIEDSNNNTTVLRNSGFAKFGKTAIPKGNGDLTIVVSKYNNNYQMLIRSLTDVNFIGARYDAAPPKGGTAISYLGAFTEDFESYPTSPSLLEVFPKYVNDAAVGNRYFQLKTFNKNKYLEMSANRGVGAYQTYFIVPVDFTAANSFSFSVNVGFYNGDVLKVYTSTDYKPLGDISDAKLTDITSNFTIPKAPTSGYGTISSAGSYAFPANLTGNGYIIFMYDGSGSGATTSLQLDDIIVK
ncbi:DUF5689 domain-containing protein [Elizabethkingia anophelis]|uniref:DUF5689 domain-containing protein n=1 Tax=Elizabethkingia anophelis TaxID=1117645 RepID=UPI00099A5553|nr:DUF5689 domain-containing protein [Elizabethkingia anophelis]OPC29546.1 hypothetical protein BAX98_11960 [Elizabethkingia anophelis]